MNIIESLHSGLAIIATNTRGNRDLANYRDDVYLVGTRDTTGLSNTIVNLISVGFTSGSRANEDTNCYSLPNVLRSITNLYEGSL